MFQKSFLSALTSALILIFTYSHAYSSGASYLTFKYKDKAFSTTRKRVSGNSFLFNEGASKKIKIATLDWPPYIGKDICRQGWVQQLTLAYLVSQDYEVLSTFFTWGKATVNVETGQYDVLYPEYYIHPEQESEIFRDKKKLELLSLSHKIPGGPVAFLKKAGKQINFDGNLAKLSGEHIGVVKGYQNTPEFDVRAQKGEFRVALASNDYNNALKLISNRVNLIIGDPAVIKFNMILNAETPDTAKSMLSKIETIYPALNYNHLYYAVSKKSKQHDQILNDLNQAITEFEHSKEFIKIIDNTNHSCGFTMESLYPYFDMS